MLMLWINCAHVSTLASFQFETIWIKSRVIIFQVFLLLKVKQLGKVKVKTFKRFGKVFGNAPLEGHCRHSHWRRWKKGWLNIAGFVIAVLQQVQLQTFLHCFKVRARWEWLEWVKVRQKKFLHRTLRSVNEHLGRANCTEHWTEHCTSNTLNSTLQRCSANPTLATLHSRLNSEHLNMCHCATWICAAVPQRSVRSSCSTVVHPVNDQLYQEGLC